jgi:UDP-N-acetyl-D-galactosamine dehydrogenase
MNFDLKDIETGVVGLGYVGLPLAVEFGRKYSIVDFDIKSSRKEELVGGTDLTLVISKDELSPETQLEFSSSVDDLVACNFYVVTVPTPIGHCVRPCSTPA